MELKRRMGIEQLEISGGRRKDQKKNKADNMGPQITEINGTKTNKGRRLD